MGRGAACARRTLRAGATAVHDQPVVEAGAGRSHPPHLPRCRARGRRTSGANSRRGLRSARVSRPAVRSGGRAWRGGAARLDCGFGASSPPANDVLGRGAVPRSGVRRPQDHLGVESAPALDRARPRLVADGRTPLSGAFSRRAGELARCQPAARRRQLGQHARTLVPIDLVAVGAQLVRGRGRRERIAVDRRRADGDRSPAAPRRAESLVLLQPEHTSARRSAGALRLRLRAARARRQRTSHVDRAPHPAAGNRSPDRRRRRALRTFHALSSLYARLLRTRPRRGEKHRRRRRARVRRCGRAAGIGSPTARRR